MSDDGQMLKCNCSVLYYNTGQVGIQIFSRRNKRKCTKISMFFSYYVIN